MTTPRHAARPLRSLATAALGLVVLLALVYGPGSLQNGFVSDDLRFIVDNPHVLDPAAGKGWLAFLHDPHTVDPMSPHGIVRPLRTLELALDHALFGLSPFAFHLHSLLWHALASVLTLVLLHRLVGSVLPAALGAAVWALHPMHVQSVAWISSRGDLAMGACVLGALLLELRRPRSARFLAGALALGAVAMLYKETAVVLPLLVFAVRLAAPREGPAGRIVPALRAAAPFLAVSVAYLAYRQIVMIGDMAHAKTFVLGGSTGGTFSTMFRGIGAYIVMALAPVRSDYDWYLEPSMSLLVPGAIAWLVVLVALVVTAVRLRARAPLVAAGISLFLFPLIPVANWPFQLGIPTAERFLYLPLLGLAVLVAHCARTRRLVPAAALVALSLGAIAFVETADWRDDTVQMQSALRHGTSPRAESWFAATEREEAAELEALAKRTDDPAARERMLAESRAKFERALDHAHRSLDLWHRFEKVTHSESDVVLIPHINAANIALYLERPGEALWHADRAIAANESRYAAAHYNRAIALSALGRHAEAVSALERAYELGTAPDDSTLARTGATCATECIRAGAFDAARRALATLRPAYPELASRGLDAVTDASRAAPRPPDTHAAQLAAVGADVPPSLFARVEDPVIRELVRGLQAERRRDDTEAATRLRTALASDTLPRPLRARAERALARIETGCAAWRDHGADVLRQ